MPKSFLRLHNVTFYREKMLMTCLLKNKTINREGVGTSKITSSKGQNIKSILKDDHNVERTSKV
jgi:hypothetical protein